MTWKINILTKRLALYPRVASAGFYQAILPSPADVLLIWAVAYGKIYSYTRHDVTQ